MEERFPQDRTFVTANKLTVLLAYDIKTKWFPSIHDWSYLRQRFISINSQNNCKTQFFLKHSFFLEKHVAAKETMEKLLVAPVKIIGGTSKKVFVTGLPDHCNIIIVGQGFVIHDEVVEGVTEINAQGPN